MDRPATTRARILDPYLPASEAARVLGVSVRTVYRLIKDGELMIDGWFHGRMRIRYSQLEDYLTKPVQSQRPVVRS